MIVRLVAGAVALLVVVLAIAATRLAAGPISLDPLLPLITQTIDDAAAPVQVRIASAGIAWQDWQSGLLITGKGVSAATPDGDTLEISALGVGFSPRAVRQLRLAPTLIDVEGAKATLVRDLDKASSATASTPTEEHAPPDAGSDDSDSLVSRILHDLTSPIGSDGPLGFLLEAHVTDAAVDVRAPAGGDPLRIAVDTAQLSRQNGRLTGQGSASIRANGAPASLRFDLRTSTPEATPATAPEATPDPPPETGPGTTIVHARVAVTGLRPATFAGLATALAPAAAADLPIDATLDADLTANGTLGQTTLALQAGAGTLSLPDDLAAKLGMPEAAQRLDVTSIALSGAASAGGETITVDKFAVAFAPGTRIAVPKPVGHRFPLVSLGGRGSFTAGELRLDALSLDLGGPKIDGSGTLRGVPDISSGSIALTATGIRVDDFRTYWPATLAPGAYEWCTEHLSRGIVPELRLNLTLGQTAKGLDVTALETTFGIEALTVDYLPPMPPVRNTRGTARLDLNTLRITIAGGETAGLRVQGGTILFPDLNAEATPIDIDLRVAGPVQSAMQLIASEPLAYPQKIGISPSQTGGDLIGRVQLRFPLLDDLEADEMQINASIDLANLRVDNIAPDVDLTRGNIHLDIDTHELRAAGKLSAAGIPLQLNWQERLTPGQSPRTHVEIAADNISAATILHSAQPFVELDDYLLGGSLAGTVQVSIDEDQAGVIDSSVDLTRTKFAIPDLGWSKPAGKPARVTAQVQIAGTHVTGVPSFSAMADGLEARGSATLDADGDLTRLDILHLVAGRTNVSGTVTKLADRWDAMINGTSLDLSPMLNRDTNANPPSAKPSASSKADQVSGDTFDPVDVLPNVTLTADLDTLWLAPDHPLRQLIATVVHEDSQWALVQMQGSLDSGNTLNVAIVPEDGDKRSLSITAEDAGEALQAMGLYSDMRGGRLTIDGTFDDTDPQSPLSGRARIRNFYIVGAPILARLLNILSLTGFRDSLAGRGILFSTLDAPFSFRQGALGVDSGRAFGSALGMTASGVVDMRGNQLAISGELVPFYAVNSALGRVPVIGWLFSGGQPGGGIFTARYRIHGDLADPQVSVYPLTVLLPSFVRSLLQTLQNWFMPLTPDIGTPLDFPG